MNLTGIAFKISGWAMVALASVSLPIIGYGIAEWGFGLEDAIGLTFFVIIPAIAGKFLIPMGNKSLQTNSISKRERTAFQIAHQSGGKITVMELSIKGNMELAEAQNCLNRIHEAGLVEIFHAKNGSILYEFPELLTDEEKGESRKML